MKIGNVPPPSKQQPNITSRLGAMLYSIASYLIGVLALVYLILFIADLFVPITINHGAGLAPELEGFAVVLWNVCLVAFWGAQHSIMARPTFKRMWTRIIPVAIERSTYLVVVAMASAILIGFWVPMPSMLWNLSGTPWATFVTSIYFLGWVIVLFSTFLINHFHLFGLQQAFNYLQRLQSKQMTFQTPLLYKFVRHPMMTGVLIALWAVPVMTSGRLLFNILMTGYVFIGLYFEERNLSEELGEEYRQYQKTTPAVIPNLRKSANPGMGTKDQLNKAR